MRYFVDGVEVNLEKLQEICEDFIYYGFFENRVVELTKVEFNPPAFYFERTKFD